MDYIEIVRIIRDDLNMYKSQLETPKLDKTKEIAAIKIRIETLTDILNKIK